MVAPSGGAAAEMEAGAGGLADNCWDFGKDMACSTQASGASTMRSTQTCPECAGRKFAVSTEFRQPNGASSNTTVPFPAITVDVKGGWVGDRKTTGRFEAWICVGCGYTTFYAYAFDHLEALAKQHPDQLRIVDAGPSTQGPYR
jgi:predicted nucleic-acid-binding Zn-ribbon protein